MANEVKLGDSQWKDKYLAQLEHYEREERRWRELEQLLKRTLSRVSMAAEGLTSSLDAQFAALRDALRHGADPIALEATINELSQVLVTQDSARGGARRRSPAHALLALWERLDWPRPVRAEARRLRRKLEHVVYPEELDALAGELSALFSAAIGAAPAPAQQPGFLARLLGGKPAAASVSNPAAPGDLNAPVAAPAAATAAVVQVAGGTVTPNDVLIELLERLTLPTEFAPRAKALRDELMGVVAAEQWPVILQGICDLIAEMRRKVQKEKEDLERFLAQLTERLQELDDRLEGTRSHQEAALLVGQALNVAVHAEVSGIASSVAAAADLDQLKGLVQDRLEKIRAHMDAFRDAEDQRHKEADQRMQALLQRLHELEQETDDLRQRVSEQRHQALRDTLTGIHNRLAYDERIDQEYVRWKRFQKPVSVIVCDVDHFKHINDAYGHKAGDNVLIAVANVLASTIRESDFIARYGGEEFVIVAPETDASAAFTLAEKLRTRLEQTPFKHHDTPVGVTISCGIAAFKPGVTPDGVFEQADQALYKAKQEGRNRCVVVRD